MEFVDGPTLDALMSAPEPIPREEVLRVLRETASGLDYAHQKGIVHRDIKPANIMLDRGHQVKIADFGIAKVTSNEQFTMTGTIVGTPNYMSPEQVQGLPTVDGRADQFSLAVIAFEMLTGDKPFTGEHLTTVVYKIVAGDPIPPRRLNPSLGPEIEKVLQKGLAKQPDARFLSCLEFVLALDKACAATKGWTNLARGGSQEIPTITDQPVVTRPPLKPTATRPRSPRLDDSSIRERHRISALTVILAVLVAAGLVGLIAWQAAPWLIGKPEAKDTKPEQIAQAPTPPPVEKPSPAKPPDSPPPSAPEPAPQATAPAEVSRPAVEQPVPEPPKPAAVEPTPLPKVEKKTPAKKMPAEVLPQAIGIVTSPAGALASLDGHSSVSCRTPCTMTVPPGRHFLEITQPGYQTEHREINVANGPQDLAPVVLHREGGTVMLSSNPQGASVTVNGKPQDKTTPLQLNLPPGTYTIGVSKDGRSESKTVQVRNGSMQILKVDLKAE